MRPAFVKGFKLFLLLFLLVFLGRWVYLAVQSERSNDYVPLPVYQPKIVEQGQFISGSTNTTTYGFEAGYEDVNLASRAQNITLKNLAKEVFPSKGSGNPPQEATYEKVGALGVRTRSFEEDEKKLRTVIREEKILIQQEKNEGLKGSRLLNLTLGVLPDKFDQVIEKIKNIGNLAAFQVTKTDRTNDYRTLLARRASLQKNLSDLLALKAQGGKVADLLALQEKIFTVEKGIQGLGLEIGQYEGPTGLCTVLLTLKEIGKGPSLLALAGRSFGWTLSWFFGLMTPLFFILIGLFILLWLAGKAKGIFEK